MGEDRGSVGVVATARGLILQYVVRHQGEQPEEVTEQINFGYTRTNFGGQRQWLLCPECERRCGKLYGVGRFKCRRCLRLTYATQYQSRVDRAIYKSQDIRRRLGGSVDVTQAFPPKPKRMRWATYERLKKKADADDETWKSWGSAHFGVPASYL